MPRQQTITVAEQHRENLHSTKLLVQLFGEECAQAAVLNAYCDIQRQNIKDMNSPPSKVRSNGSNNYEPK